MEIWDRLSTWFDADERLKLAAWEQVASPMWVVEVETPKILWANAGGLTLWNATDLEELWSRDFGSKVPAVRAHLGRVWDQATATGPVNNRSTLFPKNEPVTVDLRATALERTDGLRALLIEGSPVPEDDNRIELQRQLVTLRYTPVPVGMFASDGRLTLSNPAYYRQFGTAGLPELAWIDAEFKDAMMAMPIGGCEQEIRSDHGAVYLIRADPGLDPKDGAKILVVSFTDVTVQREQRERLEHVTHAASHDLRSPLRAIRNLAGWLVEDHGEQLDSEGRSIAEMLVARVGRMELMLDGLLAYNLAGHKTRTVSEVSLEELVRGVLDGMSTGGIDVHIVSPMPVVCVDGATVSRVLWNLIDNAVKHHDRNTGSIVVSAELQERMVCLTVQDDGPGIPADMVDTVFSPFETLRPRDVQEGSGMGLAIVKREVESAGGRIQLSSEGRGARFDVYWPLAE